VSLAERARPCDGVDGNAALPDLQGVRDEHPQRARRAAFGNDDAGGRESDLPEISRRVAREIGAWLR